MIPKIFINSQYCDLIQNPNSALKSYDLLAIKPNNEKIFDQCCNDLNIDIITISFEEKINFILKKNLIRASIDRGIFFEICYEEFIRDTFKRPNFISNVLSILEVTKGKNLIISSGSDNYIYHRSPNDLITLYIDLKEIYNYI